MTPTELVPLFEVKRHAESCGVPSRTDLTIQAWASTGRFGLSGVYRFRLPFEKVDTIFVGLRTDSIPPDTIAYRRPMEWTPHAERYPDYHGSPGIEDIGVVDLASRLSALNPDAIAKFTNAVIVRLAEDGFVRSDLATRKRRYFWPVEYETMECSACNHFKNVDQFVSARSANATVSRCLACRDKDATKSHKRLPQRNAAQARRRVEKIARIDDDRSETEKMCTHCLVKRPIEDFVSDARLVLAEDKLETNTCRRCRLADSNRVFTADQLEERKRKHREAQYWKKYVEKRLAEDPVRYRQHKNDLQKLWRDVNPDRVSEFAERTRLDPVHRFTCAFYEGIRKGLFVDPEIGSKVVEIAFDPCVYCGLESPADNAQSIDRLDSSRGYHVDNIVPSCEQCNMRKKSMDPLSYVAFAMTQDDDHAKRVAHYQVANPIVRRFPIVQSIPRNDNPTKNMFVPMHPLCDTVVRTIFDEHQKTVLRQRRPPLSDTDRQLSETLGSVLGDDFGFDEIPCDDDGNDDA